MTPAVKIFFPLLLLSTLLKAGETDCNLLIRSLQEYCLQTQNPEERQAFELRLAQLQSALACYRIDAKENAEFIDPAILSLQNELFSFFSQWKNALDRKDFSRCVRPSDKTGLSDSDITNGKNHLRSRKFPSKFSNILWVNHAIACTVPETASFSFLFHSSEHHGRLQNDSRAVTLPAYPF